MDSPHAAVDVTTLLSTPFHLHPPLTQLLCDATAALLTSPETLTAICGKKHKTHEALYEKTHRM